MPRSFPGIILFVNRRSFTVIVSPSAQPLLSNRLVKSSQSNGCSVMDCSYKHICLYAPNQIRESGKNSYYTNSLKDTPQSPLCLHSMVYVQSIQTNLPIMPIVLKHTQEDKNSQLLWTAMDGIFQRFFCCVYTLNDNSWFKLPVQLLNSGVTTLKITGDSNLHF